MTRVLHKKKRDKIKYILSRLEDSNRLMFNRMYSPNDLEQDINITIDNLPNNRVDWALTQCKNSYHQIFTVLR